MCVGGVGSRPYAMPRWPWLDIWTLARNREMPLRGRKPCELRTEAEDVVMPPVSVVESNTETHLGFMHDAGITLKQQLFPAEGGF